MNKEHVIADEVLDMITLAISKGENWMAYNNSLYFLDKGMYVFLKVEKMLCYFLNPTIAIMIILISFMFDPLQMFSDTCLMEKEIVK